MSRSNLMITATEKTYLKGKAEMLLTEEDSEGLRSTGYWAKSIAVEAQALEKLIGQQAGPFL